MIIEVPNIISYNYVPSTRIDTYGHKNHLGMVYVDLGINKN